jgi:hypothetical protein
MMFVNRVCQFEVDHSYLCVKDGGWKVCMFCLLTLTCLRCNGTASGCNNLDVVTCFENETYLSG